MAFVQAIVRGYERYGMDPSEALAQAQITPHELADPQARVTAAQFEVLSGLSPGDKVIAHPETLPAVRVAEPRQNVAVNDSRPQG